VRKLVESDEVLFMFQMIGTPSNAGGAEISEYEEGAAAIRRDRRVPLLRSQELPVDARLQSNYFVEGRIYGQYISQELPGRQGRRALSERRPSGRDYLNGIKSGLGEKAATMIVAEASYEVSDPTVDSQILKLKSAGVDVLFNASTPKFDRPDHQEECRARLEAGAHPRHQRHLGSARVMQPAGLEASRA